MRLLSMAQFRTDFVNPTPSDSRFNDGPLVNALPRYDKSKEGSWSDQEPLGTHPPRLAIPVPAFTTFTGRDQASRR